MDLQSPSIRRPFLALALHADVAGPLCDAVRNGIFSGAMQLLDICAAAGIAEARSNAVEEALVAGVPAGVFHRRGDVYWLPGVAPFGELATALSAVSLFRREVHSDADLVKVVLTPPGATSQLRDALHSRGWQEADLEHTEAVFRHLAMCASQRFVVMSPFIDNAGMISIVGLFKATKNHVHRVLVARCTDGIAPEALQAAKPELKALGVVVHNYWLPRPVGYETFHAKVVLADSNTAYIGSANMTHASLAVSMELGTFIRGASVQHLRNVVDAILTIAPIVN